MDVNKSAVSSRMPFFLKYLPDFTQSIWWIYCRRSSATILTFSLIYKFVQCQAKDAQEFGIFRKISMKANVFFLSLSHKTSSFNGSVFFLRYSQAHRSFSFHKYFLSVVSFKAKYLRVKGNLLAPWFNVYTLNSCA